MVGNSDRWYAECCATCAHVSWGTVGPRHSDLRVCAREDKDESLVVRPYECCQHFEPGHVIANH